MRRTLNPVYDEDFTFYGVHFNQLPVCMFMKFFLAQNYFYGNVISYLYLVEAYVNVSESGSTVTRET